MKLFNHVESKWGLTGLMNFVDLTAINGTAVQVDNINAGSVDIPASSAVTATMTNAEALAAAQVNGVALMQNAPSAAEYDGVAAVLIGLGSIDSLIADVVAAEAGG